MNHAAYAAAAFTTAKIAQLDELADQDAKLTLIFEWVKTGHINRSVFKTLIKQVIIVDHAISRQLGEN